MSPREPLPDRRESVNFEFDFYNLRYTCSFSRYADGRVAELFLANNKANSQSDANARESAIAASIALQSGCSLETLQRATLRDGDGTPSTPLGAALDWIAAEDAAHRTQLEENGGATETPSPLQWHYAGAREAADGVIENKHEAQAAWILPHGSGRYRIWQRDALYYVVRLKPLVADPQKFSTRTVAVKLPSWDAAVAVAEHDNARLSNEAVRTKEETS